MLNNITGVCVISEQLGKKHHLQAKSPFLDGHLNQDAFPIRQLVALVGGTGYRLAMLKVGVTGV
jgi:hypothetical protein